jgi:hypothetical protein
MAGFLTPIFCASCLRRWRCIAEGLVGGEGFAIDANMIVADAHRQRGVETPDQLDPKANRTVTEYLATLDDAAFGAAPNEAPLMVNISALF